VREKSVLPSPCPRWHRFSEVLAGLFCADYQTGHMSGADNSVEKLTGRRSMTVGEFAGAHLDKLNPKKN
jgi:hypothetical protein